MSARPESADRKAKTLLVELLVEELPPRALRKLGESFARSLADSLKAQGLAAQDATVTDFASPRRLAAQVGGVSAQAVDKVVLQKLMPVAVGLDATGAATPALLKRLHALGAGASAVATLQRAMDGKAEALFYESVVVGVTVASGLQKAVEEAIAKLPIPKAMSYQLEADCASPGWSSVSFVRPAHGLLALHGTDVVPLRVLGLASSNMTQGHRFEALRSPLVIADADSYAAVLAHEGAVIASFAERRAEIARQLAAAAGKIGDGVHVVEDAALLDEVTGLVERPNVVLCEFDTQFLAVPQECLILTMKANQKYFPLLDAMGRLTNQFLVVSNINPSDTSAIVSGNERVIRPRLADAKFFFDQDRKKTLLSRVGGLSRVVYHNKLGSQGARMERVRVLARAIGLEVGGPGTAEKAFHAATLAKADLLTDMVGEFPELQGTMGGYYARHDGEPEDIALAVEDHYKPRFAGDGVARGVTGLVVALADKLETLAGMFGTGNLPTGDKDPFALRRHALGVVRMLVETPMAVEIDVLVGAAFRCFSPQGQESGATLAALSASHWGDICMFAPFEDQALERSRLLLDFVYERFAGSLREQGYSSQEVEAVLALRPQLLGDVRGRLDAVRAFAALPEAPALAAANKRIGNILKKAPGVVAHVSESLLREPQEKALYAALRKVIPAAEALSEAGNYTASLQTLAAFRAPVDDFFDGVMVNAEATDLRLNRLGLLKALYHAMNRIADISKLAV